jgi:multicomponent Na+:H+ antiporter subunit B
VTPRFRLVLFALACLCLVPAVLHVALAMPVFGAHPLLYGDAINAAAPGERHVSNMVSAVNFDYRGFDTLGEEFMLLCAVTGTSAPRPAGSRVAPCGRAARRSRSSAASSGR